MLSPFAHYTLAPIQLVSPNCDFCLLVVERVVAGPKVARDLPDKAKRLSAAAPVVEWLRLMSPQRDVTGPQGSSSIDISRFPLSSSSCSPIVAVELIPLHDGVSPLSSSSAHPPASVLCVLRPSTLTTTLIFQPTVVRHAFCCFCRSLSARSIA